MIKSDEARKKDKNNLLPYFTQSGKDREADGDQYIANMQDGAWAGFKYFVFGGNERRISVTGRGTAFGKLKVLTERGGAPAAVIQLRPSDDDAEFSSDLSIPAGTCPLYFCFEGSGAFDFKSFTI